MTDTRPAVRVSAAIAMPPALLLLALAASSDLAVADDEPVRPVYFSGTLEEGGTPVEGTRDVTLRLYDRGTGGTRACVTSAPATTVSRGQFRVPLARSCVEAFRRAGGLWVEVEVDGTVFPDRVPIGAVSDAVDGRAASTPRVGGQPPGPARPTEDRNGAEAEPVEPPPPPLTLRRGPPSREAACPQLVAYGGIERAYERDPSALSGIVRCVFGSDTMVKVGSFWIDEYEAALVPHIFWSNGRCDGGAAPYGSAQAVDDYPDPGFPDDGNWTTPVRACSVASVVPSRMMTWPQAQQACLLVGKRLCTSSEWHAAAAGTFHPGHHAASQGGPCHTDVVDPRPTGRAGSQPTSASCCISSWGAEDMIGNLWEWVDTCDAPGSAFQMATVGASVLPVADTGQDSPTWVARLPVAPLRAGYWSYGTYAGAISPATVTSAPYHDADIGVRCCVGGS